MRTRTAALAAAVAVAVALLLVPRNAAPLAPVEDVACDATGWTFSLPAATESIVPPIPS